MINAKKFKRMLCIQVSKPSITGDVVRATRGKWDNKWGCVVTDWTSFNCAKVLELSEVFGWAGKNPDDRAALEKTGLPVIAKEPTLFPAFPKLWPEDIKKLDAEGEAAIAELELGYLKRPLWGHQRKAFKQLHNLTGPVLDMGMGVGKSMLSIALIGDRKHDFGMIVCPKSVIDVWPLEFSKNCNKNFLIYTGPEKKNRSIAEYVDKMQDAIHVAQAYSRPFVFVCNYEAIWQGMLKEFIEANSFDYIVLDEGHRIKSQSGVASKFMAKARVKADTIICCTGTLLPHSPMDAFGIFRTVDPGLFGKHHGPFKAKYAEIVVCEKDGYNGKKGGTFEKIARYKNTELMHRLISSVSYRITTKEALPDLPKFKHEVRRFKMSAASRKLYNEMSSKLYAEFDENEITAANAMVKGLRLMQITSGIVKDSEGVYHRIGTEKAALLADILEDIDKREPIIVFCNFTADIMAVREVAEKTGRTVSELSGQLNELKDWQDGKTDVLVVQIKAGKEGVDFTRSCLCFYYSIGRSLGDYEQSLFRPNRPGQTRPGTYFHLVAEDSIDEDIYNALDERKDVVTSVLDGIKRRGERLMKKK